MISLKVGSLTDLSSKLGLRGPIPRAEPAKTEPKGELAAAARAGRTRVAPSRVPAEAGACLGLTATLAAA